MKRVKRKENGELHRNQQAIAKRLVAGEVPLVMAMAWGFVEGLLDFLTGLGCWEVLNIDGSPATDPVADHTTFDVSQDLAISNMIGFRYGGYQFIQMFNGKAFPDTPTILVHEGQYARLRIINQTDLYHPIHLHGHYFSVLSKTV